MYVTPVNLRNLDLYPAATIVLSAAILAILLQIEPIASAGAKGPMPAKMLIEPGDLNQKLSEKGLRILDTRPRADYAKGHVPGAVRVDVKSWQALGKKEGGFRDAKAWGEEIGCLGIARDSRVAVYGSNLTDTARVWWTLKYLGVEDVAIVNGGWSAWTKEKLSEETTIPVVKSTTFEPRFQADRLEEIATLKKVDNADKVKIVDARSEGEFTGKQLKGKKGGHIPGATHLEWKELLGDDGRFKTPDQLRKLFRERGILPDDTAVCY
jgi:thiosulfate/3-mercaptopyruvate sulfurtransferase